MSVSVHPLKALRVLNGQSYLLLELVVASVGGEVYPVETGREGGREGGRTQRDTLLIFTTSVYTYMYVIIIIVMS